MKQIFKSIWAFIFGLSVGINIFACFICATIGEAKGESKISRPVYYESYRK